MIKRSVRILLAGLLVFCLILCGCLSSSRRSLEQANTTVPAGKGKVTPGTIINDGTGDAIAGWLLVRLKPDADPNEVCRAVDGGVLRHYEIIRECDQEKLDWYRISYGPNFSLGTAKQALLQTGQVFMAEPDYVFKNCAIPNDPDYLPDKQWGLARIEAAAGWGYTTGSEEIIIAVLDTGIDHNHPDLAAKVIDGYDAIFRETGKPGDPNGHGTHVAGIAAALTNNGTGIAGVAWGCRLMPVTVLDDIGYGSTGDIVEGILWAVENGADVINMSLGGPGYSRILHDAVEYALERNVTVVAAAGNEYKFNDNVYPAAFPGVISVGAINGRDQKAEFSTEGSHVFLAAPGDAIYSTLPSKRYGFKKGTSMAAPFVSGAVALIKSNWPELDINGVQSQLKQTVDDHGISGWDQQTGWGVLNLGKALAIQKPNVFGSLVINVDNGTGQAVDFARLLVKDDAGRNYSLLTDENGKAFLPGCAAGSYTIEAVKEGISGSTVTTVVAGSTTEVTVSFPPPPPPIPYTEFFEDAESDEPLFTASGSWAKTTETFYSLEHSWTDSPGSNYGNNWNFSLTSVPISLAGNSNPYLTFWHKYAFEKNFDYGYVEISINNGLSWTTLASYTGRSLDSWHQKAISLEAYKNEENIRIRFRLQTDISISDDGWYLDDITISEEDPVDYGPVVEFPDPNLEAAIRDALSKPAGNIYEVDLLELAYLDASSYNIQNLSGLEYCVNLKNLSLSYNQISDISALAGLTNLQYLSLWHNQISDISALAGLTNLQYLSLWHNQISDISALTGLTNLDYLDLDDNQIENIGALANLFNLQTLYLANNQISDISALAGLTNLQYLSLSYNQISDISALAGLTNLDYLDLYVNQIENIGALANLFNLQTLYLSYNQISDISALAGLTNLQYLSLSYNQISDISALAGLTNLDYLDLYVNQIENIGALANLFNLQTLYLSYNQISDISALAGLTNLDYLNLYDNQIENIGALANLFNLQTLYLSYNQISDISALAGLTNLQSLSLWHNQISDISALAGLTNLDYLDLDDNQIENIGALANLFNLQTLYLANNQISDISALAGLTNLRYLDLTDNPNLDTSPGSDNRIIIDSLIDNGCQVIFNEAGKANSLIMDKEKYKKDFTDKRFKKDISKKKMEGV